MGSSAPQYERVPDNDDNIRDEHHDIELGRLSVNEEENQDSPTKPSAPPADSSQVDGFVGQDGIVINFMRVGEPVKKFRVNRNWTIEDVKRHAFPEEFETMKVRFLHMGRVPEDVSTLEELGAEEGAFFHVVVTERHPDSEPTDPDLADSSSAENHARQPIQFLAPGQGGFAQRGQPSHLAAFRPREGTTIEFTWGFILGFFLGPIMFIFVMNRLASRKQKLGITLGILFYFIRQMSQFQSEQSDTGDGS